MSRPLCMKCRKDMTCKTNDVSLHYAGTGRVVRGDVFTCDCGAGVLMNFGKPFDLDPPSLARLRGYEEPLGKWIELQ